MPVLLPPLFAAGELSGANTSAGFVFGGAFLVLAAFCAWQWHRAEKLQREAILSHARQLAESREDAARFSDCPSALAE